MLTGSCFTEHISDRLSQLKFSVCVNPHGILFNPLSVAKSLEACMNDGSSGLDPGMFHFNEVWHNWDFHSRFSHPDKDLALRKMEDSLEEAGSFLKQADWLIITLGSAFQYFLKPGASGNEQEIAVANCHRAPAHWFEKKLLTIEEMSRRFEQVFGAVWEKNPGLRIIFTVSPVRHIREGLMENNRSKARLLELVHELAEKYEDIVYFPAYELLIDVLRDYRFYDLDMAHPNYQATQYIWEQFEQTFFGPESRELLLLLKDINIALQHQPRFPDTAAHRKFKESYLRKVLDLKKAYPYMDFEKELSCFR
jgi:hypothetical protein